MSDPRFTNDPYNNENDIVLINIKKYIATNPMGQHAKSFWTSVINDGDH